jgi:hypothetical protein
MADQKDRDSERVIGSESDEQIRGRATGEDEFDDDAEEQDEEDIDDDSDATL